MTDRGDLAGLYLPHLLRQIAERCGLGAALALASAYGGRHLSIPRRASARHPISRAVGLSVMAELCRLYGGEQILIPLGPTGQQGRRAREIARLIDQGLSAAKIARTVGCHERTVFHHRRRRQASPDPRQPSLFRAS